jgi:hypothetical protein
MGSTRSKIEKITFRDEIDFPSTTFATFGLYRYPAKFIPQIVAYVLKNYSDSHMKVFDPFAGYGTVGIVSRLYGCDYELWDINQMSSLIHTVSIMRPHRFDVWAILGQMENSRLEFRPDWNRIDYWYDQDILRFLYKIWGYYHGLKDVRVKQSIALPLLKVSRYFSYDDTQRQKLSKSRKSEEKIRSLLETDWKTKFYSMLNSEIIKLRNGQEEYQSLGPKDVNGTVRIVDSLNENLSESKDLLITSPPYLQSQEYMRQAKLDLFWLGFSEVSIKRSMGLEIPYREVERIKIRSETYDYYRDQIEEEHIKETFDNYFRGILGAFTRLQESISKYMFIFFGHSSSRGRPIPLDEIFVEHLSNYGWRHEKTLSDTIVSRQLFSYKVNPASKLVDNRTQVENMIILRRI